MGLVGGLDRYQQRHRWLGLPLAVVYKYFDDQGNLLAALLTYYGFLSLFPLLLLLVSGLGFVLESNPELQERVLDSALSQFPVIGAQLADDLHPLRGHGAAVIVGLLISVYGCMGVAQAAQTALNRIWGVSRNLRPNPVKSRLRSMLLLLVVGGGVLTTTVLSGLVTGRFGFVVHTAAILAAIALNSMLFVVAYRMLTVHPVTAAQVRGGAIAAAITWQILQALGAYYLTHYLKGASAAYGAFGVVLGLVGWIYLGALTLLLCAEVNVVRAERLWPRSLLTPFTDDVRLTKGDRQAYKSYAQTERHKGFQTVHVDFDEDGERDDRGDRCGRGER